MPKRVIALTLCAALLACVPGLAAPGTASDPAVTKGYVDNVFLPSLTQYAQSKADAVLEPAYAEAQDLLDRLRKLTTAMTDENAARSVSKRLTFRADTFQSVRLEPGDTLVGGEGTQFIVQSGWMQAGAEMINLSAGTALPYSATIPTGIMVASVGNGSLVAYNASTVLVKGYYRFVLPPKTSGADRAEALKTMGLVTGTGEGLELDRLMTRSEGVILMLNLFGESALFEAYAGASPFLDVNGTWAERGVAYAYSQGYVSGASPTLFLPNNMFSGDMFFTLILTALGYRNEFQWNTALDFAAQVGVIPQSFVAPARDHWSRGRMMYAAYQILGATYKGTNVTVLDRLVERGIVDRVTAENAMKNVM